MRWNRVVLAYLACLLVARGAGAAPHASYWYLPFVVALFVLPVWYASGAARDRWRRARWVLLAVQAVLTYVPFAVFGRGWVAGVSGLLAGLVLLNVRPPWSWLIFAGLVGAEVGLWLWVGLPLSPPVNVAAWVAIAFVDNALALFGLSRLAEMAAELAATRSELAEAAVARQRLRAEERIQRAVVGRLEALTGHVSAALAGLADSPDTVKHTMARAAALARDAVREARSATAGDGLVEDAAPVRARSGDTVAPRLARVVLIGVLILFGLQNVSNATLQGASLRWEPTTVTTAIVGGLMVIALQLRHSGLRGATRPALWPWTLALQAALTYAQFDGTKADGPVLLIFLPFLAGSVLLLISHPVRWALFIAVVLSQTALAVLPGRSTINLALVTWTAYATALGAAFGFMVYGLSRLATVATELAARRAELADLAMMREHLRLARDTHDLLGLGLSAISLKTDLITALVDADPNRARHELGELLRLATVVRNDAGSITTDRPRLSLPAEVAIAVEVLSSAGIDVRSAVPSTWDLPDLVEDVLATVLREAVTNVLRHSTATRCTVEVLSDTDTVTMSVTNDGVLSAGSDPGNGLRNLRTRLEPVAGRLEAGLTGEEFLLRTWVPA